MLPPGPYTDFLKEFADFLSDLLVNVDKALIVGDFNIHVDNTNDVLGPEYVSGVEHERSGELFVIFDHISFRAESAFLKIALCSLKTLSAALLAQPKMPFGDLLVPESVE